STSRTAPDLEPMAGSYTATDVPGKIVETGGRLARAVGEVARPRLTDLPIGAARAALLDLTAQPAADFYVRVERAIEPGVYRVQKSWEVAAAAPLDGLPPEQVCGLFAAAGLAAVGAVSVVP